MKPFCPEGDSERTAVPVAARQIWPKALAKARCVIGAESLSTYRPLCLRSTHFAWARSNERQNYVETRRGGNQRGQRWVARGNRIHAGVGCAEIFGRRR